MSSVDYNLFLGSSIGSLRGVNVKKENDVSKLVSKSLIKDEEYLTSSNEVKCLNWSDERQDELLIAMKNSVRTYDICGNTFSDCVAVPTSETCGIFKSDEKIFVGLASGSIQSIVSLNQNDHQWVEELKLNKPIERLKRSLLKNNIVATGGKDNDLKLWDINSSQMIFNAKNIKPDELQLQVPIWVSDIAFLQQNENVATCTRHGHVRLYDHLLPQRRPVFNTCQSDQVFTCMSRTHIENQFLVGSGSGHLFLVDVRGKNSFIGKYKGFTGAVKEVLCPLSNQSVVLSVSLDRYFRIHDFSSRKLILQEYMQTRLTTILSKEPFVVDEIKLEEEDDEHSSSVLSSNSKNLITKNDVKLTDCLFDKMVKINDSKGATKRSLKDKLTRKSKNSTEEPAENNHAPKRIKWKKNT